MNATWHKHTLDFYVPAKTSRNTLQQKESWFLRLSDPGATDRAVWGECGLLKSLSYDDRPGYEAKLTEVCENLAAYVADLEQLKHWPSIRFGLEMALKDWEREGDRIYFPSDFTTGTTAIPINGLIWMGDQAYMKQQIEEKLQQGFDTIKLKVGAIDFEEELALIQRVRQEFGPEVITLRLDANGAFSGKDPLEKLKIYSDYHIHSIEQPIKAGNWEEMAALCEASPVPIALDEELIGVVDEAEQQRLLETIRPPFIILKPSFVGGWAASERWVALAQSVGADWWATSALESNLGLNAIAQWTFLQDNPLPQGLGTGKLYTNNLDSPLEVADGQIHFRPEQEWGVMPFE